MFRASSGLYLSPPSGVSRGRFVAWFAMLCGVLFSLPDARAGQADGIYRPRELEGYVNFAGRRYDIPMSTLRRTLLTDGVLWVRHNRVPIHADRWARFLEDLRLGGIRGKATSRGPSRLRLRPDGDGKLTGRTENRVNAQLKGRYKLLPVRVSMRGFVHGVLQGDDLTLTAPLRVSVLGVEAKGQVRMEARRRHIAQQPPAD
jgi:hypothetical protein